MANQGILQAQLKVKNSINLENGFIDNPLLKSVEGEGEINLTDENSFKGFAGGSAIEHLDPIKSSSQNAVDLTNSLNNLSNLKYAKLEGNFNSDVEGKFINNTAMQKLDLSESLQVKPEDFKDNNNLRELPKLDYSNPDLTDIITNDTNLKPTTIDISDEPDTTKLGIHGNSTHQLGNLEFVKVNPEAPFDDQITPQIDTSYTSLNQNGLVNLFNTMPYNVGYQIIGNPTIVDGAASGFSDTDYMTIQSYIPSGDMEAQVSFIYSARSGTQSIFTVGGLFTLHAIDNTLCSYDWTYLNWRSIVGCRDGIKYKVKIIRSNNVYTFSVSENDGSFIEKTSFTSATSQSDIITIGASHNSTQNRGFSGSINLNETYIKVNSQVSTGPVDYTVVGNPTIENGIVSGFSGSKYLQASSSVPSGTSFSINAKIRTSTNTTAYRYIIGSEETRGFSLKQGLSGKIGLQVGNTGGSYHLQIEGTTLLSTETDYFVKVEYDGTSFKLYLGTSETNLNLEAIGNYTTTSAITFRFGQGWSTSSGFGFGGSIDLNNTYIKVNGKLWFGHESKQVTWFKGLPATPKVIKILGSTGESSLTNDDRAIATNKGWYINEETVYNSFPEDLPINF